MFLSQGRVVPRWKEWQPLPTQQLRLRSLVQIIGLDLGSLDLEGKICSRITGNEPNNLSDTLYSYSLHVTAMSAPFYTSEKLRGRSPKWKEIDHSVWEGSDVFNGTQSFVLRLWIHSKQDNSEEIIKVFGINLTGLVYMGPHLSGITLPEIPNSVIFLLPGGYFRIPDVSDNAATKKPHVVYVTPNSEHLRHSYSLAIFNRLNRVQAAINEKQMETNAIKQKIMRGDFVGVDRGASAALRKILNRNKPKPNQAEVNKLKEEIELARYRVELLENEKRRKETSIAANRGKFEHIAYGNAIMESRTMENYRILQKSVQKHKEWVAPHVQRREAQLHSKALLNFRIKQLISEIHYIYPVEQSGNRYTICGVYLPDAEELHRLDDVQLSVALGFVAHAVYMVSVFLQVPLRYPVIHGGSRSGIVDLIAPKLPDSGRQFPLFCKGKDKLQFNYAVYLINKNIAALRWLCGLATVDLRSTLPNLAGLLNLSGVENAVHASPSCSTREATPAVSVSSPARAVPRHRPAVSALSVTPTSSTPIERHNFSFSLDNGLDEIERRVHSRGGSESRLSYASKYLENWQVYKFFENDSDPSPGIFIEKNVSSIDAKKVGRLRRVSFGQEACDESCLSDDTADKTIESDETHSRVKAVDNIDSDTLFGQRSTLDMTKEPRIKASLSKRQTDVLETGIDNNEMYNNSTSPHHRENMLLENVELPNNFNAGRADLLEDTSCVTRDSIKTNIVNTAEETGSVSELEFHSGKAVAIDSSADKILDDTSSITRDSIKPSNVVNTTEETGNAVVIDSSVTNSVPFEKAVVLDQNIDGFEDDVADRAEALANQTSSFNMFRSRFGSRSALGTAD